MNITLTVGDYWDDGHGKHRNIVFETNTTQEVILDAYKHGCAKIGYSTYSIDIETYPNPAVVSEHISNDVMSHVADEYESQAIPVALAEKMIEAGFTVATWTGHGWDTENECDLQCFEDEYCVEGAEGFAKLWMRVAKRGLSELEYSLVEEDVIEIGGYGCFH